MGDPQRVHGKCVSWKPMHGFQNMLPKEAYLLIPFLHKNFCSTHIYVGIQHVQEKQVFYLKILLQCYLYLLLVGKVCVFIFTNYKQMKHFQQLRKNFVVNTFHSSCNISSVSDFQVSPFFYIHQINSKINFQTRKMFHKYNTHKESCGFTIYSIITGNFVSIPMPKLTSEFSN